jgi:hypothetical protein
MYQYRQRIFLGLSIVRQDVVTGVATVEDEDTSAFKNRKHFAE